MLRQQQNVTPAKAVVQGKRRESEALDSRFCGNDDKSTQTPAEIREAIRGQALAMGFDAVGFAEARLADQARADLGEFLARGYHGDMGWLAATAERRGDPQTLWPEARTIVVLGLNYGGDDDPMAAAADPER